MAGTRLEPAPVKTEIIRGQGDGRISGPWINWLTLGLVARVQAQAPVAGSLSLTGQAASLGVTPVVVSATGLYLVSFYVRVTVADGVSSSINVSIQTTDGGVSVTKTPLAAQTGNTTGSTLSWSGLLRADAGTPISVSAAYVSGGGGPAMQFSIDVVAEGALAA